jgi:hypothetical protein
MALIDPGFANVISGFVEPYAISGPESMCTDYNLSKFQGYHSGSFAEAIFGTIAKPFLSATGETYERIEDYLAGASSPMDMLTVRASPGKTSTTLSATLDALIEQGYSYKNIRCIFCRGAGGAYTAKTNIAIGGPTPVSRVRTPAAGEWEIAPPRPVVE